MDPIANGQFVLSFVCMARGTSSSMHLDLGCDGMAHVHKQAIDIWTLYKGEFPDEPQQAPALPSTSIDVSASAGVYTPALVKASSRIETQEEYQAQLSAHQEQCRQAQEEFIKGHITLRWPLLSASTKLPE